MKPPQMRKGDLVFLDGPDQSPVKIESIYPCPASRKGVLNYHVNGRFCIFSGTDFRVTRGAS